MPRPQTVTSADQLPQTRCQVVGLGAKRLAKAMRFVSAVEIRWDDVEDDRRYPFSIPAIAASVDAIEFDAAVTFVVGANGSGKSTLLEAIAVAQGMNPEGGSNNMMFETRPDTVSELHRHLTVYSEQKPRSRFFLRAESYFNVATRLEDYFADEAAELKKVYGGSPHSWSHGESFLKLAQNRFFDQGLYILDEPESALSPDGEFALMRLLQDGTAGGSQFIIATHSPVVSALPAASILLAHEAGFSPIGWEEIPAVQTTRAFLANPGDELRQRGIT